MEQILHGSVRTTKTVRRAIQHSQASLNALAAQHGLNPKTVAEWRQRDFAHDARMGLQEVRSTALTPEEEAAMVSFRKYMLLPLDDCLYALQPSFPHLTRSSLHRCLQRHGISRLPPEISPRSRNSRSTPLATSISILPKLTPMKVGRI